MENFKEKLQRLAVKCFEGEVTVTKVDLWLAMIICMLIGIVYGLLKAPMTHGLIIGSYNGNTCNPGDNRKKTGPEKQMDERKEGKI